MTLRVLSLKLSHRPVHHSHAVPSASSRPPSDPPPVASPGPSATAATPPQTGPRAAAPSGPAAAPHGFAVPEPLEFEAFPLDSDDATEPRAAFRRPAAGPALDATLDAKADEADRLDAAMEAAEGRLHAGDAAGARAALATALAVDPDYVPALELLAEVLRSGGAPHERVAVLERLLATVFDADLSAATLRELGHVKADDLHDLDGALPHFRRYLLWRPLDAEVFERVRRKLTADGRPGELAELYERKAEAWEDAEAGGADPVTAYRRAAVAWREAAALHLGAGRPAAAAAVATRGLALVPDEPELLETLVRACAATGDGPGARAAFERLAPLLLEGPHRRELEALAGEPRD